MEHVSTIVVINGAAIMAGSSLNFFAISGNIQPITFAITTVHIREYPITIAKVRLLYIR